jgi:shikimate kinase
MGQLMRTIALVGMMGAGKSAIGRRLAVRLNVAFRDADDEIESAAGCTIPEIFQRYGEPAFRDCERRVLTRLLAEPPHVLATGGGAFMDEGSRGEIKTHAVSIWLKAPVDVLLARVKRKDNRPLLKGGDPHEILTRLLEQRQPFYAQADIVCDSENGPHTATVERLLTALGERGIWVP